MKRKIKQRQSIIPSISRINRMDNHLSPQLGLLWSWSHGSWIYNYLCNQCLSPLMLWVRIPLMERCTRYNIYVINFISNWRQVNGFLSVLYFLHQWNWLPRYNWNIVESGINYHNPNPSPQPIEHKEILHIWCWKSRSWLNESWIICIFDRIFQEIC